MRVNDRIRARQIRVIDDENNQLGIMSPRDALREAEEKGLDLVEVAPNASPPVCKIMDYGKYKYEQNKRNKASKKHQHTVSVKEVQFRPKIDKHDFDYKVNHAREFLLEGNKVKIVIKFRGRELAHPEFGREILTKVVESLQDLLADSPQIGNNLRIEGRNMAIVVSPSAQKLKALAAQAQKEKAKAEEETGEQGGGETKDATADVPAQETPKPEDSPSPEETTTEAPAEQEEAKAEA